MTNRTPLVIAHIFARCEMQVRILSLYNIIEIAPIAVARFAGWDDKSPSYLGFRFAPPQAIFCRPHPRAKNPSVRSMPNAKDRPRAGCLSPLDDRRGGRWAESAGGAGRRGWIVS